jgi:hypothetical protein
MYSMIKKLLVLATVLLLVSAQMPAQAKKYPTLQKSYPAFQGDAGKWDENKVHTLSIVEVNKEGYKYWGYYGLAYYGDSDPDVRKCGLVRSNDLVHWTKFEGNPIVPSDCRWPTVAYVNGVFYMFYAEYLKNTDSRIVMLTSKDGKKFENKSTVIPLVPGWQNQNPFIYYHKQDKTFNLVYYNGQERSKEGFNNYNINLVRSTDPYKLKDIEPKTLAHSNICLAAPSLAFYNNKYYLLAESFRYGKWDDKWVTVGLVSDQIDDGYKMLNNEPPVLYDNDACAFQYVFNNQMYITYSHCLNLSKWEWELRMVKTVK